MIKYLTRDIVFHFHRDLIAKYGGSAGIRDEKLLNSAIAQPEATFDGVELHKSIFEKAAAYGFHLCCNHPFIDGNKRISLVAMVTFLHVNGYEIIADEKQMYLLIMSIANGELSKQELTKFLEIYSKPLKQ